MDTDGSKYCWNFPGFGSFFVQGQSYNPLRQVKSHSLPWLVVLNICYFHPYLGKIPIFNNIIQMGWNHQLVPSSTASFSFFRGLRPWHLASHGRGMSSSSRCWWPTTSRGGVDFWCSNTPKFNMQYLVVRYQKDGILKGYLIWKNGHFGYLNFGEVHSGKQT